MGVQQGINAVYLLDDLPIKRLYLVDNYKPHNDPFGGHPFDKKSCEFIRYTAHHNVKYSGHQNKVIFLEKNEDDVEFSEYDNFEFCKEFK